MVFGSVRFGYGSLVYFIFFVVVRGARGRNEMHVVELNFLFFFWCSFSVNTCNAAVGRQGGGGVERERVKNAIYCNLCKLRSWL